MASQPNPRRQYKERLKDELGDHRDVLEAVADLDNPLSEDAEQALRILDDTQD